MIQHQEIEREEWTWLDDLDRITDHSMIMFHELVNKPVEEVIDSFLDSCPTEVEDLKLAILIQFCRVAERAGKGKEIMKMVEYLAKQRKKHD
jgi:hypothetical protein